MEWIILVAKVLLLFLTIPGLLREAPPVFGPPRILIHHFQEVIAGVSRPPVAFW